MSNRAQNDRRRLLGIVLASSSFPGLPHLPDNPAFENSAREVRAYLDHLRNVFAGVTVIDLVGTSLRIDELLKLLRRELGGTADVTDIVFYFAGHGSFLAGTSEFFFPIASTTKGDEDFTGLRVSTLARTLDIPGGNPRVFVILDCCFAAEAASAFQSGAVGHAMAQIAIGDLPTGTSLLAAASRNDVALSPQGAQHTMFTGSLLRVLRKAWAEYPELLTIRELGDLVRRDLRTSFGSSAVMPEVHTPKQRGGDPSDVGIFAHGWVAFPSQLVRLPGPTERDLASRLIGRRVRAVEALAGQLQSRSADTREQAVGELRRLAEHDDTAALRALAAGAIDSGKALESSGRDGVRHSAMSISLDPSRRRIEPGSQVVWRWRIYNRGLAPIHDIELFEAGRGSISKVGTIQPGRNKSATFVRHYGSRAPQLSVRAIGVGVNGEPVTASAIDRVRLQRREAQSRGPEKNVSGVAATPAGVRWPEPTPNGRAVQVPITDTSTAAWQPPGTTQTPLRPAIGHSYVGFEISLGKAVREAPLGDHVVNQALEALRWGAYAVDVLRGRRERPRDWEQRIDTWRLRVMNLVGDNATTISLVVTRPADVIGLLQSLAKLVDRRTGYQIDLHEMENL